MSSISLAMSMHLFAVDNSVRNTISMIELSKKLSRRPLKS